MSKAPTHSATPRRRHTAALTLLACLGISPVQATGSLYVSRNFPEHFLHGNRHVTLLPDGTLFKYSDCFAYADICTNEFPATGDYAEASVWNPGTQQWDTRSVAAYRSEFTSTLTHDGRIVMVGGWIEFNHHSIATTAIYDSRTQTLGPGPTLDEPRHRHTATELTDGGVLVAGGEIAPARTTAGVELITASGRRKTLRAMMEDRARHTATRLAAGDILVVGGSRYIPRIQYPGSINPDPRLPELAILDTVELYDVAKDRWSAMPPLPAPRADHTATLLPDGRVLIIGGWGGDDRNPQSVAASALLWNPATGHWSATQDLPRGRRGHIATLLPSGNVLVSGGWDERGAPIQDLLLWDHRTGQWVEAGRAPDTVELIDHTATLLPNGNVLLVPAFAGKMAVWSPLPATEPADNWVSPREGPTITALTDGRFLMAGGEFRYGPMFYAHIYDPATQRWSDTEDMHYPRKYHHATRLADGRVLVFGGSTAGGSQPPYALQETVPAEIWDPGTGKWKVFPSLVTGRCSTQFSNGIPPRKEGPECVDAWSTEVRSFADGRVLLGAELSTAADAPREYSYRTWIPGDLPPTPAERIESPRSGGRFTLLDDGRLVYIGGRDSSSAQSKALDIFDFNSKHWQPAATLLHPLASPVILDLGDRRLLIFEGSGGGPAATADLWDEASGSTRSITLPSDLMASDARAGRQNAAEPPEVTPEPVRSGSWRAISLSSGKILLITEERSYLAESPYERWETIRNAVKVRTVHSHIAPSRNGNALAFTGAPLPAGLKFCESCLDAAYTGQYELSEFDSTQRQWHSISSSGDQEQTLREEPGPTRWPANLIQNGAPFHFLVVPHPGIDFKVRTHSPRELFLVACLLLILTVALIYWRTPDRGTA